jgi:hypothetical protein
MRIEVEADETDAKEVLEDFVVPLLANVLEHNPLKFCEAYLGDKFDGRYEQLSETSFQLSVTDDIDGTKSALIFKAVPHSTMQLLSQRANTRRQPDETLP